MRATAGFVSEFRPSDEAIRNLNRILWQSALRQMRERFPDYHFYDELPSELSRVAEVLDPERPQIRGVHSSYLAWPRRDSFSYKTAPLTPDEVLARVVVKVDFEEEDSKLGDET